VASVFCKIFKAVKSNKLSAFFLPRFVKNKFNSSLKELFLTPVLFWKKITSKFIFQQIFLFYLFSKRGAFPYNLIMRYALRKTSSVNGKVET
jgi:hypothetical protein